MDWMTVDLPSRLNWLLFCPHGQLRLCWESVKRVSYPLGTETNQTAMPLCDNGAVKTWYKCANCDEVWWLLETWWFEKRFGGVEDGRYSLIIKVILKFLLFCCLTRCWLDVWCFCYEVSWISRLFFYSTQILSFRNILLATTYSFEHGKLMDLNPINYRSKTKENKLKKHNEDIV